MQMGGGGGDVCALPVGMLWRGLPGKGELSDAQLLQLQAVGVKEIIVNTNSAAARGKWKWEGSRRAVLARCERYLAAGFSLGLMPWVWCRPAFMQACGAQLRALCDDLGVGAVRLVQMDWEGSAERSAKDGAKRAGVSMAQWVDRCLSVLVAGLPDDVRLGITTLYFRRAAGDAAIKWVGAGGCRVSEWIGQFYSPWLTSPPHSAKKAKATHAANFQPGILQARGHDFYASLYPYLDTTGAGLNLWALKRPQMQAAQALDLAVEQVRLQPHGWVGGWAGHLIMNNSARFELALRMYDRLCLGGVRVLDGGGSAAAAAQWPDNPPGADVKWRGVWVDPKVADGGRPAGCVRIRAVGLTARDVGRLARVVRKVCLQRGWIRGTCVPVTFKTRSLVCVFQKHTATWVGGKTVLGDYDGLTVFAAEVA